MDLGPADEPRPFASAESPAVSAVRRRLGELASMTSGERVGAFEAIHRSLHDALAEIDGTGPPTAVGTPAAADRSS